MISDKKPEGSEFAPFSMIRDSRRAVFGRRRAKRFNNDDEVSKISLSIAQYTLVSRHIHFVFSSSSFCSSLLQAQVLKLPVVVVHHTSNSQTGNLDDLSPQTHASPHSAMSRTAKLFKGRVVRCTDCITFIRNENPVPPTKPTTYLFLTMEVLSSVVNTALGPLRPFLQPITSSLPAPIYSLAESLFGTQCTKTLLINLDPTPACLSLAISKTLGVGIIAASSIVKLPQILKLMSSKSPAGLSVVSLVLETASYMIGLAYNFRNEFPVSTYGETALIAIQNIVITCLVFHYGGQGALAGSFIAVLAAFGYGLLNEQLVDPARLTQLMAAAGVMGVVSKVPQILTIWQQGGTGQLSAFAVSGSRLKR
jgi:mannose-P-dolichol utilization defect protein 1